MGFTMKLLIVLSVLAVAAAIPYRPPCGVLRPPIVGPGGLPPPDIQDPIVGPGGLPPQPQERIIGPGGIYRPKEPIYGPGGIYRPIRRIRRSGCFRRRRPIRYC